MNFVNLFTIIRLGNLKKCVALLLESHTKTIDAIMGMEGSPSSMEMLSHQIPSDVALLDLLGIKFTVDLNIPRFKDFGCALASLVWPNSGEPKLWGCF